VVREHDGQGIVGCVDTPAAIAPRAMRLGSAAFCGLPPAAQGPATQVHLADDAGWLASFELEETLRPGAAPALARLRRLGLQVQLLSGDGMQAVQRLAERAGIAHAFGQRSPQDKLQHVRRLQRAGRRVVMVGDGMNDGPVLACADASIALGDAVPLARASCDFIIPGGQVDAVATLLLQARRARRVVRQNLAWAATYNAASVPLAVAGLMPPWLAGLGMAASSLIVVLNAARLARLPD